MSYFLSTIQLTTYTRTEYYKISLNCCFGLQGLGSALEMIGVLRSVCKFISPDMLLDVPKKSKRRHIS